MSFFVNFPPANAAAGVNKELNFQGRLLNAQGATVPDGYYNIQFKIYQDGDGQTAGNVTGSPAGSLKWTESWLNANGKGVLVRNGYLSVQLGSITPFGTSVDWNQDKLWLSMNVAGTNAACTPFTGCSPDGEMVPMKRLSATPYALNAGQLEGKTAADFIQNTTAFQTANLAIQGAANASAVVSIAAGSSTGNLLQVGNGSTSGLTISNVGNTTFHGNVAIGAARTLTLGAACTSGQVLSTDASAVVACVNTGSGVNTVGAIDSQPKSANGAVIVGTNIYFQTADATNPGLVSTGAQTFAGTKTFGADLIVNASSSFTGNLIDVKHNGVSRLSVSEVGNTIVAGTLSVGSTINTASSYQIGGTNVLTSNGLSFTSPSAASIAAASGQSLTVQGGAATALNTSGGNLTLTGGAGNGTGTKGLVKLGPSAHLATTNASCATNCTITQSNVDNYGTIIVNATGTDLTITLPAPTNTTTLGRTVFVTTSATSQDFTLATNTGTDLIEVAMRKNTTSTMIWNGTGWTPGGASNATTLQATYNNGSNPATTPEIKLDNIRGTIDIQDADTSIGTDILNVRGSNSGGLGTVLFGVSNTGRVTIQGTSDEYSAFRVLNASGDYLFNINSSNNYVISNAIRSAGNEIANPGFESGGLITGGEEGWFGPATASIAENNANARTGNNTLAITASSANIDVFAGSYYEINAGESLYLSGWVKNSAGANGNAGLQITWYNKDKGVISSSTAYPTTPGTTYVQRSVGATAPVGTVYARVSATIRNTATTGTFYFDDFYMKRNLESADMTFRNATNSTTAFRIQSAGGSNTLFSADTATNAVRIGDNTGSDTDTTVLVVDSATSDPTSVTGLNGGIFYRSDSGSLKAIVGGAVVDICTTAVTCAGYSASAGSTIQLQGTSPGTAQTGNFNITGTGILTAIKTQDNASGSTQNLSIKTGNAGAGNSGNLTIDTGTATGTRGTITIGTGNVAVKMEGTLAIQGSNALSLGQTAATDGSLLLHSSAAAGTSITIKAPSTLPSTYVLTLPSTTPGNGECLKTDSAGIMFWQGCGVGVNFNLQDAYNNSPTPANIALADGKNFQITASDTSGNDPSIVMRLECGTGNGCTGTNGRFIVQNSTTDLLSVLPNGRIVLNGPTSIGSGSTADSTQTIFQLDTYAGSTDAASTCSSSMNNGALYYNSSMGSIRGCINGSWNDISNPDTLGLLTFGIVPSSGSHPYDLPSLITPGYTGPCRASWAGQFKIHIEPCTAYSNGRRVTVNATNLFTTQAAATAAAATDPGAPYTNLTTTAQWAHICLDGITGQPTFTSTTGLTSATAGMPTFSAAQPILCIADVKGSATTSGVIDDLYDVRTFTSAMKEAVTTATAVELGMIADSSGSAIAPATCPGTTCSGKLYGLVVATNGQVSTSDPNTIVTSVGPGFVKAISGSAGQFAKGSTTAGYATTISTIPNNAFYFSPGNARTTFETTCTAANNCNGSMYVNFIVR